jgi:hypothetical protein
MSKRVVCKWGNQMHLSIPNTETPSPIWEIPSKRQASGSDVSPPILSSFHEYSPNTT